MARRVNTLEQAPHNADGHLLSYVAGWTAAVWVPNVPFHAVLRITGMERGRSAAHFVAESTKTGARYTIFMADMLEILQERQVNHGKVAGVWQVRKRGTNYGLALAP